MKNKSVRNLGFLWLIISPIALILGVLSGMIDGSGKSIWFYASRDLWLFAGLIYLVCGSAAINLFDSEKYYKTGVILAVSPFCILAIHIVTVVVYW